MEQCNNDTIHIIFAINDSYSAQCAVVITSILKNSKAFFHFHVLDGGISESNKNKIAKLKRVRDFNISYHDMKNFDFSELPLNRDWISVETYYRLFIPDIIDKTINKVIYLDCDIIVKGDLFNLYNTDLGNNLFGAVLDETYKDNAERLGIKKYFNAGVLIFNLAKLREINLASKCIEFYKQNNKKIIYQDQDILNGLFSENTKYVPFIWNVTSLLYLKDVCENNLYISAEEQVQALKTPMIIHYTGGGRNKPWVENSIHPLAYEYFNYLKFTPYKINYIKKCLQFMFSIKNSENHKIINILGIKVKIKRRKKISHK